MSGTTNSIETLMEDIRLAKFQSTISDDYKHADIQALRELYIQELTEENRIELLNQCVDEALSILEARSINNELPWRYNDDDLSFDENYCRLQDIIVCTVEAWLAVGYDNIEQVLMLYQECKEPDSEPLQYDPIMYQHIKQAYEQQFKQQHRTTAKN